jgi:predicted Zn-dependent peptidase
MDQAIQKSVLKNGVRILTKRMPHIHSVSMGVWVNVGARDESLAESGLSHFIEHMIFKVLKTRVTMRKSWTHTWIPWSIFSLIYF